MVKSELLKPVVFIVFLSACLLIVCYGNASAEWLFYDDGAPEHESSDLPFQGVRFSLPDTMVRAPLLSIEFYYATIYEFCPVTLSITDHDHSIPLGDPIGYSAVDGWNFLDVSQMGMTVPHNFYIVIENTGCGSPVLDSSLSMDRSFKGRHLASLTTRFSRNLVLRAEVGIPIDIPVYEEWRMAVNEKMILKGEEIGKQKIMSDHEELMILYEDGSLAMDNGLFGYWMQKGKKFRFSLDPEDLREFIADLLMNEFDSETSGVIVTKTDFTGKVKKNGLMQGTWKIFANVTLYDSDTGTKVTIKKKYLEIPDEF